MKKNEHLFKLKKDGKTVGYLKLAEGWTQFQRLGRNEWYLPCDFNWDYAHQFVTKDKNGKDVFVGDKVKMLKKKDFLEGEICEVGWNQFWNCYWLTCDKDNTNYWYGGWVELIEDKEDE